MWGTEGLECIFDLTSYQEDLKKYEKELIWSTLKGDNSLPVKPPPPPLQMMILRARVNSQRCYEIYEFVSSIPLEEVKHSLTENPQPIVNWIRKNGHKIYSDYSPTKKQLIS